MLVLKIISSKYHSPFHMLLISSECSLDNKMD